MIYINDFNNINYMNDITMIKQNDFNTISKLILEYNTINNRTYTYRKISNKQVLKLIENIGIRINRIKQLDIIIDKHE